MVYCHNMNTNDPKEYISLHSQSENYAEFYDKRYLWIFTLNKKKIIPQLLHIIININSL